MDDMEFAIKAELLVTTTEKEQHPIRLSEFRCAKKWEVDNPNKLTSWHGCEIVGL